MHLTADEQKTLDTINSHQDAFYGDGKEVTRDKLDTISKDDKADPAVKEAATQLLNDPLLFGLLNNSITGYKKPHRFFGGGHVVDSGKISQDDFRRFYDNMSAANKTVDKPVTHDASSAEQQKAVSDMLMGKDDPPAIKKPKKDVGVFQEGLHEFLKWDSKILDWMSVGLSALNGIPIIGEITDAASIALESEAQAAQVVDTAIQGGDMSLALKLAGINMAGAVVGAVGGPTARIGAKAVAKGVAEAAAKGTAKGVAKGAGKTAAERPSATEFAKGYVGGTAISKSVEILKMPVLAGLHYEEYQLDKQKDGEIHQKMENAGGIPMGKQIVPTNVANNFEGDLRQNLRNIRVRRR